MAASSVAFASSPTRLLSCTPKPARSSVRPVPRRAWRVSRGRCPSAQAFSTSTQRCEQQRHRKESFSARLRTALRNTKVQWYPIPVGLGIGFLGLAHLYKVNLRRAADGEYEEDGRPLASADRSEEAEGSGGERGGRRPKRRKRIRPEGPWTVKVMSTLPLKAISRLWGRFNEVEIPYYLRVPGFRLYSWLFGVNLSEVYESDLHVYPNLAAFFYRTLKPGVRPLDPNPNALLSPADGRVIQFGTILSGEVEQVKGVTYSLDALLGSREPGASSNSKASASSNISSSSGSPQPSAIRETRDGQELIDHDEEFARVNGISYTLPNLFSGPVHDSPRRKPAPADQSTTPKPSSEAEVRADLALSEAHRPWWAPRSTKTSTALYYIVIYLAPGDYHRFHSPVSWVVERRRHFAGELFSVSPYLQRTLPGLFTLNERVVLIGRWRWGFFSYIPVGATNVGSIVINFDRELRTNSLTTDTEADQAAEEAQARGEAYSGFAEATYQGAGKLLGGHALKRGEEIGGFRLGSTIVIVFEAPTGRRKSFDEGFGEGERKGGWEWAVETGQRVKVGQAIGYVLEGS